MTRTSDPLVGSVLDGRYEIVERIARGGMATVYVAQDLRLARRCAVKVMHEGLSDDREFTRKFDREARAAAKLTHPHVVAVFDQGRDVGRPYIVMEYVPGTTLRRVISTDGPLAPARALELMDPVLSALAAAHRAGLVHRDVKPENVLISQRGEVKVADFGLARAISGDTSTATQGLLIGTVSYIPPELVMQGRADARSDVYSAGVVLFELLTGRKPHTGDSPIQVAYAHCNTDIEPPSSLLPTSWRDSRSAIPPYVDALVLAAVSRDPARRPRDAGVFLDHLRVAARALDRGIMNDARLDAEMRVVDADATMRIPSSPSQAPTVAIAQGVETTGPISRWVAKGRSMRTTPATPISPVDLPSMSSVEGIPFYDDVEAEVTPIDQPVPVPAITKPARRRRGSTRVAAPRRRRRFAPLVAVLLVLALAGGAAYTSWYLLAGQFTSVPAMAGMSLDQAYGAAATGRVHTTTVREYSETVPADTVIRTDPSSGTKVHQDAQVTLVVSQGPERFTVPTLVGQRVDAARAALAKVNLAVGQVTQAFDEKQSTGTVLDASLRPGAQVKRGTSVDLVVSKGPKPIPVTNYTGKDAKAAQDALTKAGFKVTTTEANHKTIAAGLVISQSPDSGEGRKGDVVTLVVSKGPVMVTVPETRRMRIDAATATLKKAGFDVKVEKLPNPAPLGIVSYTTPAGGSKAPEGSTVTLYSV